jgi:uncharacterized protein YciW
VSEPDSALAQADTLDRVLGIKPGSLAHVRHERQKVVDATQASEDLLLGAPIEGLSVRDRLFVALLACALTPAPELLAEYAQRLKSMGASTDLIDQVSASKIDGLDDERLKQILEFTRTLIIEPIKADKQALLSLKAAGLTTPQITALAQLIAFVSYQVRVCAGLKALKAHGAKA